MKAMKVIYEGHHFRILAAQVANSKLKGLKYLNEKRDKFNYQSYLAAHKQCHQDLVFGNVHLTDPMKIDHFQAGIKNPNLHTDVRVMAQNPAIMNDFDKFSSVLASNVAWERSQSSSTSSLVTRNVSSTHANRSKYRVNNGRGRGRGHGGRNQGRGGNRDRGRGRNTYIPTPSQTNHVSRYYTSEEWANLSSKERQMVYNERDASQTTGVNNISTRVSNLEESIQSLDPGTSSVSNTKPGSVQVPLGRAGTASRRGS